MENNTNVIIKKGWEMDVFCLEEKFMKETMEVISHI